MAAREMGGLSFAAVTRDALLLCELLANADPSPYELAALQARPSVRAC